MDEPRYIILLESIAKCLVDYPDLVKTTRKLDEMGVLLTLQVDPKDMGKVVGRQGSTAKAMRTILRAAGMKENAVVSLKILEPDDSERGMEGSV